MSMRRPRFRATANLAYAAKRKSRVQAVTEDATKPKTEESQPVKVEKVEPEQETIVVTYNKTVPPEDATKSNTSNTTSPPDTVSETPKTAIADEQQVVYVLTTLESPEATSGPLKSFDEAFKYPQNIDYKRPSAVVPVEEKSSSDFEDNILHMDLQKSPGFPMSPTKSRQRIRPTPIFGQRRNSFVGTSPSPHTEDESSGYTRQRSSNSTSSDVGNSFLMRKLAAGSLGRIRTESGCSTISDSRASSRKNASDEHRHVTKREFQNRFNGKVPDKSTLKMFDLIYYNPTTNPMEQKSAGAAQVAGESDPNESTEVVISPKPVEPVVEPKTSVAMPVPQLKLGSNGEMMIDEKSLEIETTAEVEARKALANSSLIYHDENTGGEGFYAKHQRTKYWLPDETIKFYRCLQTVGTDFSLMLTLFPNRTRRDLKLKFKKEERCNLNLINKALLYPGTFNIEDLKTQLDTEEQKRLEDERRWKEIREQKAKQIKKAKNAQSSSSRVLVSGDEIYQNENVTKAKLSKRAVTSVPVSQSKSKRKKTNKELPSPSSESNNLTDLEGDFNTIIGIGDSLDSVSDNGSLSEASLGYILNELANGTLAFVSSVDPANPDKTVNEVYILCKETGELSDTPLDLPEDIIEAIHSVMTS